MLAIMDLLNQLHMNVLYRHLSHHNHKGVSQVPGLRNPGTAQSLTLDASNLTLVHHPQPENYPSEPGAAQSLTLTHQKILGLAPHQEMITHPAHYPQEHLYPELTQP